MFLPDREAKPQSNDPFHSHVIRGLKGNSHHNSRSFPQRGCPTSWRESLPCAALMDRIFPSPTSSAPSPLYPSDTAPPQTQSSRKLHTPARPPSPNPPLAPLPPAPFPLP